ncbi:putative malate dehydrogenase (oxaloacetate-decarboxylating) (NADP(+)) [Rosa chinensis]|uniref:Putative malate dehydrogenase (Oxaloacetate-decarboxylating) (NADP(+)) n=1 Tax=Rosa chinensis TaxID=74649 RepID=A0A2P6R5W8_ROSCH|nr:putative malate dehydrogenase (oxaloacetate-decarboxylating) (NADP(+)) [Rosa chinensis]
MCYSGHNLLREPRCNKGLAFTEKERDAHYLRGLLPPAVLTQELQEKKMMHNLRKYEVPWKRFAGLKDTLFSRYTAELFCAEICIRTIYPKVFPQFRG